MIWIFSHCFQISRKLGAALLSLELVLSIIQPGKYYVAHGSWIPPYARQHEHNSMSCKDLSLVPLIWLPILSMWPAAPHLLLANDVHYGNTVHRVGLLPAAALYTFYSAQTAGWGEGDDLALWSYGWTRSPSFSLAITLCTELLFFKIHGINYLENVSTLKKYLVKFKLVKKI